VSRRAISFAIAMAPMARPSFVASQRWVYGIARFRLGLAERLIGSIRRDCLDHVVSLSEQHLRHLLNSYQGYYNESRTHLSLRKDAPIPRDAKRVGACSRRQSWAAFTIGTSGFEYPTGTGPDRLPVSVDYQHRRSTRQSETEVFSIIFALANHKVDPPIV